MYKEAVCYELSVGLIWIMQQVGPLMFLFKF